MESALCPPADPKFRLIETCLWTPDVGVHRVERHLDRLMRSAKRLGIAPKGVEAALASVTGKSALRLRLTVDAAGRVDVSYHAFEPTPPLRVWRVEVSKTRLSASDPWLSIKSTERALYDATRASLPDKVDEVIFLNEQGEVCEGTITNVFVDMGQGLLTPPLSCGVLPGVFRADLLSQGRAKEAILHSDQLQQAQALYVGNALRGLIRAVLI